jgi:hypothetical protein
MTFLFFAIPVSTWASFIVQQVQKHYSDGTEINYQVMFYIGGALAAINIVLLFWFDDKQMISQESLKKIKNGESIVVNGK